MGIPLPKGFKLPDGISYKEAQRAMQAAGECTTLVEKLLKDSFVGSLIRTYINDHAEDFPVLSDSLI